MTNDQGIELLQMIESAYPTFLRGNETIVKKRIKLWKYKLLSWDYQKAKINIVEHIDSNVFPPTIADIKPYESEFDDITKKLNQVYE